ncbi:hypothetical protein Csa_020450, partial [Cucumis sativus]
MFTNSPFFPFHRRFQRLPLAASLANLVLSSHSTFFWLFVTSKGHLPPQICSPHSTSSPRHPSARSTPGNGSLFSSQDADPLSSCLLRAPHLPPLTLLPLVATWITFSFNFLFFI